MKKTTSTQLGYTNEHAQSGLKEALAPIEVWPNQFKNYIITIEIPEFTSVCPKTNLPDFGKITISYIPDKWCCELKSLKYYILGYRNLGIFYENAVNRIARDFFTMVKPQWLKVRGEFNIRGGMRSIVEVEKTKKK
ncbi:MAG: preQ(1) synthase [candidate division WOR-3 bacterium]|nr:preQ(1) synthase [candidate division WOR-3 bacterium]MCX7757484.1 preQ(1) synthase [candidate division WOR-3 bacterium]MDW7987137.1 preQ(1) synthase [candidate division WOR-3 bacterium]